MLGVERCLHQRDSDYAFLHVGDEFIVSYSLLEVPKLFCACAYESTLLLSARACCDACDDWFTRLQSRPISSVMEVGVGTYRVSGGYGCICVWEVSAGWR